MKHLELTKASEKTLRGYAAGHGRVFLSEGDGCTTRSFDLGFFRTCTGTYLYMGTAKSIRLTEEQAAVLGDYAGDQTQPREDDAQGWQRMPEISCPTCKGFADCDGLHD